MNKDGDYLIELCAEKGLIITYTSFGDKNIHNYTWVTGEDGREGLIDYDLLQKEFKNDYSM